MRLLCDFGRVVVTTSVLNETLTAAVGEKMCGHDGDEEYINWFDVCF